jgi:hypothetical protein
LSARIEVLEERVVLRLSLKNSLPPNWLERVTLTLFIGTTHHHCTPTWREPDGNVASAELRLQSGELPPVDGSSEYFTNVDLVTIHFGSSAKNLHNESSRAAFQARQTMPDESQC